MKKRNAVFVMGILFILTVMSFYTPSTAQARLNTDIMLTPETHDILTAGSTFDITWKGLPGEEISLGLMIDGSYTSMITILEDTPEDSIGHYTWTVPDVDSEVCQILLDYRYVDLAGWHDDEIEGGMFTIRPAATLSTPLILQAYAFVAAPANLTAEGETNSIILNWEDKSTNEEGFSVERMAAGYDYIEIETLSPNVTSWEDGSAEANTEYSYRVRAYKGSGYSAYSNAVEAAVTEGESPSPSPVVPGPSPASSSDGVVMKFYIGKTEYYVNGQLETMDVVPEILEGRTILPIRFVAEALGAQVAWEAAERKVTVTGAKTIELFINSPAAKVNGNLTFIDPKNEKVTPVILPHGRTMVPLRFTAEALGCSVEWKAETQEIILRYPD